MAMQPTAEHLWLSQLVGRWTYKMECVMGPDQPVMELDGEEAVRQLGQLWVLCEGQGAMPGGVMSSVMALGFDPARGRFIGSWVGSPMAAMFVYEGIRDDTGCVLTLDTTGPSFSDPTKLARYQDVVELHPDGRRLLLSQIMTDDGSWHRFMTTRFTRVG